jgi:hypothetical protein
VDDGVVPLLDVSGEEDWSLALGGSLDGEVVPPLGCPGLGFESQPTPARPSAAPPSTPATIRSVCRRDVVVASARVSASKSARRSEPIDPPSASAGSRGDVRTAICMVSADEMIHRG